MLHSLTGKQQRRLQGDFEGPMDGKFRVSHTHKSALWIPSPNDWANLLKSLFGWRLARPPERADGYLHGGDLSP